ncbi:MAG: NAD(P)-dependent oxidoreductase [Candidatus Omnitrophica bacterium]|nr:NAD(P)-dependent oxidoreductase [Candidatus Omnitrophota bacterium]
MINNLVLGSEGFVGKSFSYYLNKIGEKVVRFDIKRSQKEDLRYVKINFKGIDKIYFFAWDVGGAKYLYEKESQFIQLDWNLKLLLNVMPQIQSSNLPFIFISSQLAEEYDTVYGVTKRLGEIWTHLLKGVRVRLWNVYGTPEMPSERSHVIGDLIYQALTNKKLKLMTNGEEKRQFIHIDDASRAFHIALSSNLQGVYDVTSFEWVSIIDIADIIAKITKSTINKGKCIGNTPNTPIKGKIPGWQPKVNLYEGLKRQIDQTRQIINLKNK